VISKPSFQKENTMSKQHDYWRECMSNASDKCGLDLTPEQLDCLASAAENGHDSYGMAFYSPPPSERINDIENEFKKKLQELQAEFDAYKINSETAVKKALRVKSDECISIHPHGEVFSYGGRIVKIQ
jgi:hypothetical protein